MDLSNATWRKASRSHDDGDACIEVASARDVIAMRDSKDPDGSKIVMCRSDFVAFAVILKSL